MPGCRLGTVDYWPIIDSIRPSVVLIERAYGLGTYFNSMAIWNRSMAQKVLSRATERGGIVVEVAAKAIKSAKGVSLRDDAAAVKTEKAVCQYRNRSGWNLDEPTCRPPRGGWDSMRLASWSSVLLKTPS